MPRQHLRPHADDAAPEVGEPETAIEPEDSAAIDEESSSVEAEPLTEAAEVAPAARRRRFPWRRAKTEAPEPEPKAAVDPEAEAEADVEPPEVEAAESSDTTVESDTDVDTATDEADGADEEAPEPILVPHRTAGRAWKVAAVAAGTLVVAACAFAGATLQPYLADRAAVKIKLDVATTAADAITTLWTYTPDDIDKLADRTAKYLGGDFAAQYRQFIDGIVEPNKQAQVTNSTQVLGAAVESLTPTEATVLVYTNSVSTSPATKGIPSLRYLSYRLTLESRDQKWLITRMSAITSLDLTPRL